MKYLGRCFQAMGFISVGSRLFQFPPNLFHPSLCAMLHCFCLAGCQTFVQHHLLQLFKLVELPLKVFPSWLSGESECHVQHQQGDKDTEKILVRGVHCKKNSGHCTLMVYDSVCVAHYRFYSVVKEESEEISWMPQCHVFIENRRILIDFRCCLNTLKNIANTLQYLHVHAW